MAMEDGMIITYRGLQGHKLQKASSLSALVSETGIIVISMVPTLEILVLKFNRSVLVNCFM